MTNIILLFMQKNFIIELAEEPFMRRAWDTRACKRLQEMYRDIQRGDVDRIPLVVDRRALAGVVEVLGVE